MRLVILICFYLLSSSLHAQSVQFMSDMNAAVKAFDAASTAKEYQAVYLLLMTPQNHPHFKFTEHDI